MSQIFSRPECQTRNTSLNVTLNETRIDVPTRIFQQGDTEFDITTNLNNQKTKQCPRLDDTVRFNGKLILKLLYTIHIVA